VFVGHQLPGSVLSAVLAAKRLKHHEQASSKEDVGRRIPDAMGLGQDGKLVSGTLSPSQDSIPLSEPAPADPPLSDQQAGILAKILAGENFFFTGSAGTGKSVLLRAIIKAFHANNSAASRIGGAATEERWKAYLDGTGNGESGEIHRGQGQFGHMVNRWQLGVTATTGMAGM
jgi:hypothetical protein